MSDSNVLPELREILGTLIFGAERPLSINEMLRCLREVAESEGGETAPFGEVRKKEITEALADLAETLKKMRVGFTLSETAGGYRLQSNSRCSPWLKNLLNIGRPQRLSRPALETLAIIAYRQPATKAQIEGVRGVTVDHLVKSLMELQLVKIVGRSDLPGRPFLYGTTHSFLEHFGLSNLSELNNIEPMLAMRPGKLERPAAETGEADAGSEKPVEAAREEAFDETQSPLTDEAGKADVAEGTER